MRPFSVDGAGPANECLRASFPLRRQHTRRGVWLVSTVILSPVTPSSPMAQEELGRTEAVLTFACSYIGCFDHPFPVFPPWQWQAGSNIVWFARKLKMQVPSLSMAPTSADLGRKDLASFVCSLGMSVPVFPSEAQ